MPPEMLLFGALGLLLVFMIFNTRRRSKAMREEQEKKRTQTLPGVKVLLQGGLFGTVVSYDADDLDAPALIELAPGTVVEVHSQAILRIVDPIEDALEEDADADEPIELPDAAHDEIDIEADIDADPEIVVETPEETRARLERDEK